MAAANPSSRPHAVSGPAPFSPSEALTAIKLLLPRLDNWHICDGAPQEFCGWIAINQRKARTFGDSIRGLRTSVPKSSQFSDDYKLVADQACHGEPPEKSSNETTATSPTALIKQPESLVGRGETLQMLKDFSDRLEPRRDEEDWKHLVAMFDRLLKLPAYDGIGPSGKSPSYVSTSVWLIVGRNIHSLDSRLLNDLEGAAVALVQSAAKTPPPPSGKMLTGSERADGKQPKPKGRRGRPKGSLTTDPKADEMIANEWAGGHRKFATHEELADALQKPVDEVSAALKRHASRQKHDK